MAQPPTRDVLASNLYQQAIAIESRDAADHDLHRAIRLLEEAVARDASFVRAYSALARLDLVLYDGPEHTPARLEKARRALEKSTQLAPDAGEVHLVRARYLARVMRDYDGARLELELARRLLPNDAGVYYESAMMDRRQGRGVEALQHFDRAIELDPLNTEYICDAADTCSSFRDYAKAVRLCQRALALDPHDNSARLFAACQPLSERADTRPLRKELNTVLAEDSVVASSIFGYSWSCAILERNAEAADRALATAPEESRGYSGTLLPREWFQGYTDWVFNRPEMARSAFIAAAAILEKHLRDTPDDALGWSLLGKVRAALGQKQAAIEAGQRACDLMPLSKEPNWGLEQLKRLAVIYAWVGEKDRALQLLNLYAGQLRFNDYGAFKLHPDWDALRGDPRFEKIVASLAPPTGAHR